MLVVLLLLLHVHALLETGLERLKKSIRNDTLVVLFRKLDSRFRIGQKYAFSVYTTLYDTVGINVSANGAPIILSGPYGTWDGTPTGAIWRQVTGAFIADGISSTIVMLGSHSHS